jgi:PAS domain S-box-containing protein
LNAAVGQPRLEAIHNGERELADFFHNASIAFHWVDADGIILEANQADLDLLGYGRDEYIGRNIADFHVDQRAIADILERLRRAETLRDLPARLRRKDGAVRDVLIYSSALMEGGRFVHTRCVTIDVTGRRRAEETLKAREGELELVARTTPLVLTRCSRDLRYLFVNHAAAALFGRAPEEMIGQRIEDVMGAEALEIIRPHVEQVLRGEPVEYEAEIPYPGGLRWMRVSYEPDRDERGDVVGWVASIVDITERRRAEAALRESELRFRHMADSAPVLIWMSGVDKACTWFNRPWLEFTGRTMEEEIGDGWAVGVHGDDLERCIDTYVSAFDARAPFSMEYRLRRHDGVYRWILDNGVPIYGADGEFVGYIGSCIDIDQRKKTEEHRQLLLDELNHRVKNTLSVVQGIAQQTFRSAEPTRDATRAFEGRLAALGKAHGILTRTNWEEALLHDVAEEAVAVCGAARARVTLAGPPVALRPRQALSIAMALHELCTNAVKYGSLSNDAGSVALRWQVHDGPTGPLELTWREAGGPVVAAPAARGYGSMMIEKALAHELQGAVTLEFPPEGVACAIAVPLEPNQKGAS